MEKFESGIWYKHLGSATLRKRRSLKGRFPFVYFSSTWKMVFFPTFSKVPTTILNLSYGCAPNDKKYKGDWYILLPSK
jgi:hypothetical protein